MVDPRITYTPNLKLTKLPENFHVWAQIMNDNLSTVDAAVSAFIAFNNLRGPWSNSTAYAIGDSVVDVENATIWSCQVAHTSSSIPNTFLDDRTAFPNYWSSYTAVANARGAWTGPGTSYLLNDFVVAGGNKYAVCLVAHVSSASFTTDTAAGFWSVLIDLSAAGSLVLPVLSGLADANKFTVTNPAGTAYTVQTMLNALTAGGATSIGLSLLTAVSQAAARTAINAVDATGATSFGLSLLTTADLNTLIAMVGGVPTGTVNPFAGGSVPNGWLLCAGQTVARASFPNLFGVISTTYNTGGEAGTDFRLPDLRGRLIAGLDNMGGSSAGRLTSASMSPNATTLGATGGAQQGAASTFVSLNSGGTNNINFGSPGLNFFSASAFVNANSVGGLQFGGSGVATEAGDQVVINAISANTTINGNFGINVTGSGSFGSAAFNITQPTMLMNAIIKT
jgi:microcystin-dependent protein